MKLIKPKFEILQSKGLYEDIEIAARTCYQSQDKIMQGSAEKIVSNLIDRGHGAMLEHGTVYLTILTSRNKELDEASTIKEVLIQGFRRNSYSRIKMELDKETGGVFHYITTNYRVIIENNWFAHVPYITAPTKYHEKRISVRFTCDIGVSREFNRHRVDSIAEQSTRYCNFSKEQFGSEITFIQPDWVDDYNLNGLDNENNVLKQLCHEISKGEIDGWNAVDYWLFSLMAAEFSYFGCLSKGWSAQQARDCLNLSTKTELIHTAFVSDWKHFFSLRDAVTAHPSARELATPLHQEFKNLKLI